MSEIDFIQWIETIKFGIDTMDVNQIQTLVDLPERIKPIQCKWVFKKKTNVDGNLQIYEENFLLVAMVKSI